MNKDHHWKNPSRIQANSQTNAYDRPGLLSRNNRRTINRLAAVHERPSGGSP